ncbi:hypothetical protein ECANGB1_157 [Enterospora canceri]|uniref:Uncharacterized protein n=1 Tax=Enterospora canceri TaxID=1081671 RepID=A0A1Y1S8E4_9MICR|nr:hypothetical protein ECANGB1_157 [Enterospora canceri]
MKCTLDECALIKCGDGDLTVKGYEQAQTLGQHINDAYFSQIGKKGGAVVGVHTGLNRTQAMLQGVLSQLPTSNKSTILDFQLINPTSCFDQKMVKKQEDVYKFDRIMTSLCNDVPYDCKDDSCDYSSVAQFIGNEAMLFEDKMAEMKENRGLTGTVFSYYAQQLLEYLDGESSLVLVSAHDSTLNMLMSGLDVAVSSFPSYAAALFVEVYEHGGKEYVRINYGGKQVEFGFYREKHVALAEFRKFLRLFGSQYEEVKRTCFIEKDSQKRSDKLSAIFDPLSRAIEKHKAKKRKSSLLGSISSRLFTQGSDRRSHLFNWIRNKISSAKCGTELPIKPTEKPRPQESFSTEEGNCGSGCNGNSCGSCGSCNSSGCNSCNDKCNSGCDDKCNNDKCNDKCNSCNDKCNDGCNSGCTDKCNDNCLTKPMPCKQSKKVTFTNADILNCGADYKPEPCTKPEPSVRLSDVTGRTDCIAYATKIRAADLLRSQSQTTAPCNAPVLPKPLPCNKSVNVDAAMRAIYGQ